MACPVWSPGLIQQEIKTIERVQRTAMAMRETLCLKFAINAFKHPKFTNWFVRNDLSIPSRSTKPPLKTIKTRTIRFKKSPIPYLTGLLDQYLAKKKTDNATEWTKIMNHVDSIIVSHHTDKPSL